MGRLLTARALLKEDSGFLAQTGRSKCDIRVNLADVPVSGDVYAEFWKPSYPLNIIYYAISASAVAFGGWKDGVIIMARQHQREAQHNTGSKAGKISYRTKQMGPRPDCHL